MHATIYYDSDLQMRMQVAILKKWIGKMGDTNPENNYHIYDGVAVSYWFSPPQGIKIEMNRNPTYLESWMDYDNFRFVLEYNDNELNLPEEESLRNIIEALQLFWDSGVPTFVAGYDDYDLPYNGGIDGPVPWPKIGQNK